MKVILIGYPGSQKIAPLSKYLTSKYIPFDYFDFFYLNHKGDINKWSEYVSAFLSYLEDRWVVFALDDYLISNMMDECMFLKGWDDMNSDVVCVKLCHCTPEENEEYPITTQWCLWNKEYLIWLLNQVNTPWEFEIKGSAIFKQGDKKVLHRPCLEYFTNSSISSRWEGIRLDGLKEEDIKYIKENGLI